MYEYKVIVRKHRRVVGGRFDHDDLEALLNNESLEGWVLDRFLDPAVTDIMEDGKPVHVMIFRRRRE